MKKIPTLFERIYESHRVVGITPKVTPGMEWVLEGKGQATIKVDGSCCAVIDGGFYKRFDAKKGKKAPAGAVPCCDPDPITGHWPHWAPVDFASPADKWLVEAYKSGSDYEDGTYEAIGPHFQGNPYSLDHDVLYRHGADQAVVVRSFEGIRDYLKQHEIEGIVFWLDGEPRCKIKRRDFGFQWPVKGERK